MIKTVMNTINEYDMIKKGGKVTAALSGGADSICLLHILNRLKSELEISLDAVHINHCIRGDESDRDEEFCRKFCRKLGVPLKVYRIDIPKIAEKSGKSLEETARDKRYEKFLECAGKDGRIATAHTLSDNAETVIINLIRGTGLKGLCGIPPVRDNIIRPLMGVTRQQVEEYLDGCGQDYVTDSTNFSNDYTRNKIRHNIIPIMLEINNGFYKSFLNSNRIINSENQFIETQVDQRYKSCCNGNTLKGVSDYDELIKKRIIWKFLKENDLPISFEKINQIAKLTEKDGKINICKNVFIVGENGNIYIEKKFRKINGEDIEIPLKIGSSSIYENIIFKAEITDRLDDRKNLIDLDKASGKIILRNRRYGDKIKLMGRDFTSSVKKLINEKVPHEKRKHLHFLSDDKGLIFMEDFGAADRVKADENSKNILKITIEQKKSK